MSDIDVAKAEQALFLAEHFGDSGSKILPYDLDELPLDKPWSEWILDAPDSEVRALWHGIELGITERQRRAFLVEWATSLVRGSRLRASYERGLERGKELPGKLAKEREANASRLRAYAEATRIRRLGPERIKKSAQLKIRCPQGCFLAAVFTRRGHPTESQLILTADRDRRDSGWLWPDSEARPESHPERYRVGCEHGEGAIPAEYVPELLPTQNANRLINVFPGASWTPRHRRSIR